jgi:lipopolysaccharide/colanic/teichoic acid biosynthesis glycosyltransferase
MPGAGEPVPAATRLSRVLAGEVQPAPLEHHDSLVEQYATMAHAFQARPVDHLLRLLDVTIAGAALALSSPVMLLIAVALKLSSPRAPVIYRGSRVGRGGHLFRMLKFRTLAPDAEQRLGPYLGPELTHLTQDEVTRIGRGLRASRLDELPQLINVLAGEMSLVGPRPIRPRFFGELVTGIPEYWQRLVVRPGLNRLP